MNLFEILGTFRIDKATGLADLKSVDAEGKKSADAMGGHMEGMGERVNSTMKKVAGYIGAAFAVAKIVDFVKDSVQAFSEFEAATTKMFATMDPLPEETKQAIIADIKDISNQYGILAKDVTAAYDVAGDLGVPLDGLKEFMGHAAQLSKVLGTDITTAAKALAVTVQGLGGAFKDTAAVADIFFKVAETGDVDITTLQTAFAKLLPVAQDLGVGMTEIAAHIATVSQQGTPAKSAISGIQAALDELSDPASDVAALFEGLAGKTFQEFIKSGGTLSEALGMIAQSATDTGTPLNQLFTSVEAAKTVLLTTGDSADLLTKNLESMGSAASGVADSYGRMAETTEERMKRMQAVLDNLKIDLGGKIMEALQPVFTWLSEHTDDIKAFFEVIGQVVAGLLQIIGPVITSIVSILSGLLAFLRGDWQGAWEGLNGFMQGIWSAIVAIFDVTGIKDLFIGMFGGIRDFAKGVIDTVTGWITAMVDTATKAVDSVKRFFGVSSDIQGVSGVVEESIKKSADALSKLDQKGAAAGKQMEFFAQHVE